MKTAAFRHFHQQGTRLLIPAFGGSNPPAPANSPADSLAFQSYQAVALFGTIGEGCRTLVGTLL